jgi:lipopolysaccharide export system permease protein
MLYGIMIYRMTGSYEDAAIILADSGMMQSTAEKKHLLLTLHSGEWFENMRSQELVSSASVPYRRETFSTKRIVLDFDSGFSLTDASDLRNNAQGKSWAQIMHDVDSMNVEADSLARANYATALRMYFHVLDTISKKDSIKAVKTAATKAINIDTLFNRLDNSRKQMAVSQAMSSVSGVTNDLEFKAMLSHDTEARIRMHRIEAIGKFTLALSCLIFFFIGAPLGAIIRKGGLGVPVIISVLVFIIFYIFDNTGYRMARLGAWPIWFGKGIATAVLTPVAIFFTYKANKDSVVFNMDAYRTLFTKLLGLRLKRHITGKEVIIEDPDYLKDATDLQRLSEEVTTYAHAHKLMLPPNIIKVFFKYEPDHEIERISEEMETVIEDLGNTKDKHIISMLNHYPVVSTKAHTRPFERRWMNIMAFILIPIGAFLYIRMWSFRLRLLRDLRTIKQTNANIVNRINETHINK